MTEQLARFPLPPMPARKFVESFEIGEIVVTSFGDYRCVGIVDGVMQLEPIEETTCPIL